MQHFRCSVCAGLLILLAALVAPHPAVADDAPAWVRAQAGAPVPDHDDKTAAVQMYSETILTVSPRGTMVRFERDVFKILRSDGEGRGVVRINFDAQTRITALRAWCIPPAGKAYEVRERDAIDTGLAGVENGELASDIRTRLLQIPAATPGSIVAYEWEQEQRPYVMADEWEFQDTIPVREAHYRLQLPAGWAYKITWLNHEEMPATVTGTGKWLWSLHDIAAIRPEPAMPPWRGVAGSMTVSLLPPNSTDGVLQSWSALGAWYAALTRGRREPSPQIRQKVAELTASVPTLLGKMRALAAFVQDDIRYVAVELGIGGHQPHPAADVFSHRYGDCKDKVTLLGAMLKEIGVDSYYVLINTERGSVIAATPPNLYFDHAIMAIVLPAEVDDTQLRALRADPQLGKLLFFDPTDPLTPFGRLRGALQANFGLLVTTDAGTLVELPQLATNENSVNRSAKMTLDEHGTLHGDMVEVMIGDRAATQRDALRSVNQDTDQIRPVERLAAASFTDFTIVKAAVANLHAADLPFEWHFEIEAKNFAKVAGDLLLVRPRLIGSDTSSLLETKEPRRYPIEFDAAKRDTDAFEVTLPPGYLVDEMPAPVHVQYDFGTYDSKTEINGRLLRYTRTVEIRNLSLPADRADDLKQFYRAISGDERNSVILKRASR